MNLKLRLLLFVLCFLPAISFAQGDSDEIIASKDLAMVEFESGKVRGYLSNGIYTYKGIPYAFAERFMPPQKVSAELLNELELKAEDIDELQKLAYYNLITAGNKAIATVRKEARNKGDRIAGSILGPVHDKYFLPYNLLTPEALKLSKDVSIMIGTTKNEFSAGASARTGEDMEAVRKAYPNTLKASDYLAIDFMFRAGAIRDANTLVSAGHANTYLYLFAWQSPVDDGSLKFMHCMELPFVFNNIKLGKEITGGGKEAYDLAETVSGAWINFARTGNPNTEGLPNWPRYSLEEGASMIIDTESEVKYHHDKQLLEIVMPDRVK